MKLKNGFSPGLKTGCKPVLFNSDTIICDKFILNQFSSIRGINQPWWPSGLRHQFPQFMYGDALGPRFESQSGQEYFYGCGIYNGNAYSLPPSEMDIVS